jgi:predicted nucleic acid-binding protein
LRIELETKAKLFIQKLIVDGRVDLAISFVSEQENEANPFEQRKVPINGFFKYAKYKVEATAAGEQLALEIQASGLKAEDAAHIASAIAAKCDYLFTTDDNMLKYRDERIIIKNPMDFVLLWEAEENE